MLAQLQNVVTDSFDKVALSLPHDPPRAPGEVDIDQVLVTALGETSPKPHLLVRIGNLRGLGFVLNSCDLSYFCDLVN